MADKAKTQGSKAQQAGKPGGGSPGSKPSGKSKSGEKVTTEGSARVLNEVKGRLEKMEAGDLPVIEKVAPDGTSRRVDPTGEMVRPIPEEVAAVTQAAEAFANQHLAGEYDAPKPAAKQKPAPKKTPSSEGPQEAAQPKGFFARILGWFKRS